VPIPADPIIVEVSAPSEALNEEAESSADFGFIRRGGDISEALTVSYAVGGTATRGDDYEGLSGTVTFAANDATAKATVTAIDDDDLDASTTEGQKHNETIIVTLTGHNGGDDVELSDLPATAEITDGVRWWHSGWRNISSELRTAPDFMS
jgi:hypothetical protein